MRFIASFATLLILAACATAPPPGAELSPPVSPAAAAPSRAAQLLAAAGGANAPTRAEIEQVLGPADIARQDGAGAVLTYRFEHCALLLLFASDARNALRLAEAHASARRGGEAMPSLDQCAGEAPAR